MILLQFQLDSWICSVHQLTSQNAFIWNMFFQFLSKKCSNLSFSSSGLFGSDPSVLTLSKVLRAYLFWGTYSP